MAAHLEELFLQHGAPLFLKRDNGGNLNHPAVNRLLERFGVIPLNSPKHYPPYNGAIEKCQDEMKRRLAGWTPQTLQVYAAVAAHELNHRRRRSLAWRTACAVFCSGAHRLKAYNRRRRKESFDQIKALAMQIVSTMRGASCPELDAAAIETASTVWRLAVETWLHRNGLITVTVDGKVLPHFPLFRSHN